MNTNSPPAPSGSAPAPGAGPADFVGRPRDPSLSCQHYPSPRTASVTNSIDCCLPYLSGLRCRPDCFLSVVAHLQPTRCERTSGQGAACTRGWAQRMGGLEPLDCSVQPHIAPELLASCQQPRRVRWACRVGARVGQRPVASETRRSRRAATLAWVPQGLDRPPFSADRATLYRCTRVERWSEQPLAQGAPAWPAARTAHSASPRQMQSAISPSTGVSRPLGGWPISTEPCFSRSPALRPGS